MQISLESGSGGLAELVGGNCRREGRVVATEQDRGFRKVKLGRPQKTSVGLCADNSTETFGNQAQIEFDKSIKHLKSSQLVSHNSRMSLHDTENSQQQEEMAYSERVIPLGDAQQHLGSFYPLPEFQPFDEKSQRSEEEMMSSLNFSIEDLLSKISKVTESFDPSPKVGIEKLLPENDSCNKNQSKQHFQSQSEEGAKELYERQTAKSSNCSSERRTQNKRTTFTKIQQIQQDEPIGQTMKHSSPLLDNEKKQGLINSASSGQLSAESKVKTLFSAEDIREVEASRIMEDREQSVREDIAEDLNILSNRGAMCKSYVEESPIELSMRYFHLGKCIGSGKFGDVYLCQHKTTGGIFALKKIFKATILEYGLVDQFVLQLKINYLMDHPNIVKLYAHFSDEYHIFLLMEYAEGGMLMNYLKKDEEFVGHVVSQVLNGVEYLHKNKIAHRDIKPQNIVVLFQDNVKLCDFGWSAILDEDVMKKTFCGTLDYVSPEMKDKGEYSFHVDLWSIGVLTFELLTGSVPFKEEITQWKRNGARRNAPWDWSVSYPNVSDHAQSFMQHLLQKNPSDRASIRFCKSHRFIRCNNYSKTNIAVERSQEIESIF